MIREEFLAQLPDLYKIYQPSAKVLKQIGNVTLCMIVGPSGVGKSTLIAQSGLAFVPSDTTRDIRPGEQDGVDMYFRKDYDQVIDDIKNGRFVQIVPFATGDLYATKSTSYPDSGVAIMPIMVTAIPAFRALGFANTISAFVSPPSYEEWMQRMATHITSPELLERRLSEAQNSLQFALEDQDMHFILNDDIDPAVEQLKNLVNGQVDSGREKDAKKAAEDILQKLQAK